MQENTISDVRETLARGDRDAALAMIDRILTTNPTAEGWTLAAEIIEGEADKIKCLEQALAIDPNYEKARTMYAALGQLTPPRTASESAEPRSSGSSLPPLDFPDDDQDADTDQVRRENGKTITVEGVYEMLWDCKYCGSEKLLGKTHKFCPVCGAQQDASWRYYPSDAEKVAVNDHRFVGADKVCPNCSSLNVADAEFCTRCGAPQSAASAVKAQAARAAAGTAAAGVQSFVTEDLDARQMVEKYGQPAATTASQRPRWLFPVIGVAVLGVIAFILFAVFAKRDESGFVSALDWERSIDIQRFVAVQDSQICPAPADAYGITQRREQVDTRQVPDGETCTSQQVDQGDGTFRQERVCTTRYRSEPVYGNVCYFTVNRWGYSRTVQADAASSASLAWPVTNLNSAAGSSNCSGLLPVLGCEKEGDRKERYTVVITAAEGRTFTCDMPLDEWQDTPVEATFSFKVRIIGGGIDCSTLQRTG